MTDAEILAHIKALPPERREKIHGMILAKPGKRGRKPKDGTRQLTRLVVEMMIAEPNITRHAAITKALNTPLGKQVVKAAGKPSLVRDRIEQCWKEYRGAIVREIEAERGPVNIPGSLQRPEGGLLECKDILQEKDYLSIGTIDYGARR